MLRYFTVFLPTLSLAFLTACAPPSNETAGTGTAGTETNAAAVLTEVGDDLWNFMLEESVGLRLQEGLPVESLTDLSHEHAAASAARMREMLERLDAGGTDGLSHAEEVLHATLRWNLDSAVRLADHERLLTYITPYSFAFSELHTPLQKIPVTDAEGAASYLALAKTYPGVVATLKSRLEGQLEAGIVVPAPAMPPIIAMWKGFDAQPQSVFMALAGENLPEGFAEEMMTLIENEVRPAWQNMAAFLEGPYLAAAPEGVGLGQYPGGAEAYKALAEYHTSLSLTPEEIHRIGRERLETNNKRLAKIREELGFTGTQQEFHAQLAKDPRFFVKTPEEVGERLMSHIRRLEPLVSDYFMTQPKAPYGVRRLLPQLEGSMTYGYYDSPRVDKPKGEYHFNGSKLDQRSLIGAASLIFHELVPGHHFQIALQNENETLPKWQQQPAHTAFVEGWAEYSSMLAEEMGMYEDPYDLYGRLVFENFFACRLISDTGMAVLGMTLEESRQLMRDNLLESEVQIVTETLRYSTDLPGQALAYGLGATKIHELREKARAELGDKFDIRRFHDAVLGYGSIPLTVLEEHIDWFIREESGS